jgi:hypothetical protein
MQDAGIQRGIAIGVRFFDRDPLTQSSLCVIQFTAVLPGRAVQ